MLRIAKKDDAVELEVKVVPNASRTRYLGEWDGRARIAVAAPPEQGKANREVIGFLAKKLGVRRNAVALISGHGSPLKTVRVSGVTPEAVHAALASHPSGREAAP